MPVIRTAGTDDIVRLYQRILQTPDVRPDVGFFEQGGDSLLAVRVLSAVARTFGTELTISELYEASSPAALAGLIQESAA